MIRLTCWYECSVSVRVNETGFELGLNFGLVQILTFGTNRVRVRISTFACAKQYAVKVEIQTSPQFTGNPDLNQDRISP